MAGPTCKYCGRPVVGLPRDNTVHGIGWVHRDSNKELCWTGKPADIPDY